MNTLWERAKSCMPGGVNSPVRAFGAVGLDPIIVKKAKGPYIFDVEGSQYIDLVMSWGPLIFGHAHQEIIEAVSRAVIDGTSFGALCEKEIILAESIIEAIDSIEKVRMTSSGTEASMTAIRLARAATKRDKIIKFDGCYHGHTDALLVKAGSGVATFGISGSEGVATKVVEDTIVATYNDLESVEEILKKYGDDIACIIVEPVAANMGVVPPIKGFLDGLRVLCDQYESLLIFDEVITGFRLSYGGAQTVYQVKPDLTILGKIIGGGFPVGAVGGRGDLMDLLAPLGSVYQAGTLSGNPVAMIAGTKTLSLLGNPGVYKKLEEKSKRLDDGLKALIKQSSMPFIVQRCGSLMTMFFTEQPVRNYCDAKCCNQDHFKRFYQSMYIKGVFLPPSSYEAFFVSLVHDDESLNSVIDAAKTVLEQ